MQKEVDIMNFAEALEDHYIRVESGWLKEHTSHFHEVILEMIEKFADDPVDETTAEDIERWNDGTFLIDIYFAEKGLKASKAETGASINPQTTFTVGSYAYFAERGLKKLVLKAIEELA